MPSVGLGLLTDSRLRSGKRLSGHDPMHSPAMRGIVVQIILTDFSSFPAAALGRERPQPGRRLTEPAFF